jgi:DNA-binding beta-propeller fold protein YncE
LAAAFVTSPGTGMLIRGVDRCYEALGAWGRLPAGESFGEVAAVAADSTGTVVAFSRSTRPLNRFTPEGILLAAWGAGAFRRPHGLWIAPDGTLYCVDDLDHTIAHYTPAGDLIRRFGQSGRPSDTGATSVDYRTIRRAAGPFHYPTDLAGAPNGDLYVADGYGNARVHCFSPAGELRFSWGEPGGGPGQFRIPHGIAADADGRIWVADRENCRLQVFDPAGRFLFEWAELARPCAVFVDPAGEVYVAELGFRAGMWPGTEPPTPDATGGRVSVFSPAGDLLARWGGGRNPLAPDDFFAPHDLWVTPAGDVYVAEVTLSAGGNRGLTPPETPCLRKFVRQPAGQA